MISMGLAEIQKNISVLSDLKEPIRIMDKRKNIGLATIISSKKHRSILQIGGIFKNKITSDKINLDFSKIRLEAKDLYFKDKYAKNNGY